MITILTPTYNRAHTLPALFKSLQIQTGSFEWIIIDDGSTDNTSKLIESFMSTSPFPIVYHHQRNGGKHSAINTGMTLANAEWIFIVDSDDRLTNDAIATIYANTYPLATYIQGIVFRKMYSNGSLIGTSTQFKKPITLTPTEAGILFQGDLAYIFRKEALQNNPFPIISGETFIPELYVWNRISDQGKILYFPDKGVYIAEYLDDGYTKNFKSNLKRNPKGFALFYRDQFFRETSLVRKFKMAIRYLQCHLYGLL